MNTCIVEETGESFDVLSKDEDKYTVLDMEQIPLTDNLLYSVIDNKTQERKLLIKKHPTSRSTGYQVRKNYSQIEFMAEDKVIARGPKGWYFHHQTYQ